MAIYHMLSLQLQYSVFHAQKQIINARKMALLSQDCSVVKSPPKAEDNLGLLTDFCRAPKKKIIRKVSGCDLNSTTQEL